jgi:hypothetical protein
VRSMGAATPKKKALKLFLVNDAAKRRRTSPDEANQLRVHEASWSKQDSAGFIPEIFASQLPADLASDKRSGNKYKFRVQPTDISTLQPQPPRKDIRS